jgi:hypothetical protein
MRASMRASNARCASLFVLICLGAALHGSTCSEYYVPIDKPYVRGSDSLVKWDPIVFALQVRSFVSFRFDLVTTPRLRPSG